MRLTERPFGKGAVAAHHTVKDLDNGRDMFAKGKAGANMFGRPRHQGIDSVHIQLKDVGDIGRNTTAGEPADVFQSINQPGKIIQIIQGGGTV